MKQIEPKILIAALGISFFLNVGIGVSLISSANKNEDLLEKISAINHNNYSMDLEVISKTEELTSLQHDLERIFNERKKLGLSNDSLQLQISELKSNIAELKKTAKLDREAKMILDKLITKLKNEVLQKDRHISILTAQRDSLTTSLTNLQAEKDEMHETLIYTTQTLADASILKAENLKIAGLKTNGKEFRNEILNSRRLDRVKITFQIADNKVAKKGNKRLFIALTTPKGEIFSDIRNGGGIITLKNGNRTFYTINQDILFKNKKEVVNFTMPKGFDYVPGNYNLAIFADGHKIGEGDFIVK